MVSKKWLDRGFNGFRPPVIPKAPRSIRRSGPRKKLVDDSKLCAFELLAAVAGKLLQESEGSASSNVAEGKSRVDNLRNRNEKVELKDDKALKLENFEHGSCAESSFIPEISVQERNLLSNFKGIPQVETDYVVEQTSVHAISDPLEKIDCDIKLGICEDNSADENTTCKIGGSICVGDSFNHKVESKSEEDEKTPLGYLSMANTSSVNDPIDECVNTNIVINSESSVKLPLYRDSIPSALLRKRWNNVKLGARDDDENSFGCNKFSTKSRPSLRPQPHIGRHRMRKMMASKYWKTAPKLKDYELYNTSEGMMSCYRYRKNIYTRERCQRVPLKKRKLLDHSFDCAYDLERSCDSISNLPEKGTRGDKNSSNVILRRASGTSSKGHPKTKDPQVKFSIKSFKVPELYIEVPETATVGSLKRTVMDAVNAILGGGIRVGVVFQEKKVKDDHRTLKQTGISQCSNLDNLDFTLERSFTQLSPSVTPKKPPVASPCVAEQTLPRSPMMVSEISNASVDPQPNIVNKKEIISASKTTDIALMDGPISDSKALIIVPPMNPDALAVVPATPKPKRSELSQRRTRRPFSVGEVEALVEAVETLGTGRWRDVKMRAFENADYRTYVDLKDKWKTLVHTATISPQQRRGEPVPQELLNRVLSAHSYWSQHQSKQHGKHPIEPLKIVDSCQEIIEA